GLERAQLPRGDRRERDRREDRPRHPVLGAAFIVMVRAMRIGRSPFHRARLACLAALWVCLGVRIPAAMAADSSQPRIWSMQLHGGLFAPTEANGASPTLGVRYCKHYTPQFYGGMLTGWTLKRASLQELTQDPTNPGPRVEVA